VRIGIGYDVHQLVEGRELILGGVKIPYPKGLEGHSDADVLTHAICDALLGAVGEADLGEHFPVNDARYKGICSLELLKEVGRLLAGKGWTIENIDSVVVMEAPKVRPFKRKMKERICETLGLDSDRINVKATTTEGLGYLGRSEAVASYAVCLLEKSNI